MLTCILKTKRNFLLWKKNLF